MDEQQPTDEEVIKQRRQRRVRDILRTIKKGEDHWSATFAEMRESMAFVRTGMVKSEREMKEDDAYVVNLAKRYVQQMAPTLYAQNPTIVAKPKPKLRYTMWDGSAETITNAYMQLQELSMAPPTPEAAMALADLSALIEDYERGRADEHMVTKLGETMVLLLNYFTNEQTPSYKLRLKRLVRRAMIAKVGYIKVGFRRQLEPMLEDIRSADSDANTMAHREGIKETVANPEGKYNPSQEAELQMQEQTAQSVQQKLMMNEGLVYSYPHATDIILDPNLDNFDGFEGAGWGAQRYYLTCQEVMDYYQTDLKNSKVITYGNLYDARDDLRSGWDSGEVSDRSADPRKARLSKVTDDSIVCVYEFYDRYNGIFCVVCEGHDDYLDEPRAPDTRFEQFYPWFAYLPNDADDLESAYPKAPVEDIRPMQVEINRLRRALREHRIANLPRYAALKGSMDESDAANLANAEPHTVTFLAALGDDPDVSKLLQAVQTVGVDPNLYDTAPIMQDAQLTAGMQESAFGMMSGGTATEASIAEQSRGGLTAASVAALDDFLTVVARASAQCLRQHMTAQSVQAIVGQGAVWPMLSMQQIADELYIDIEAGSSGRPDQQIEVANFERMVPLLLQIPNINPEWLAKEAIRRLNDKADITEAMVPNMGSIMSLNKTPPPSDVPAEQGAQGGENEEVPPQSEGSNADHGADAEVVTGREQADARQ